MIDINILLIRLISEKTDSNDVKILIPNDGRMVYHDGIKVSYDFLMTSLYL